MVRSSRYLVAAGVVGVLAFFVLMALAYWVPGARWLDGTALQGFVSLGEHPHIRSLAHVLSHICDPAPFALLGLGLVGATALTRGPRRAAAVLLLLVGANAS